jgi:DNA-binding NtrC family response regulator
MTEMAPPVPKMSCEAADVSQIVTVLSVSPTETDHAALEQIFENTPNADGPLAWSLRRTMHAGEALELLESGDIPIVICEQHLGDTSWKDVLRGIARLHRPPFLVVTSRLADNYLWAEALNLGAYDVLAKPFYTEEVIRTLGSAWRRWAN